MGTLNNRGFLLIGIFRRKMITVKQVAVWKSHIQKLK